MKLKKQRNPYCMVDIIIEEKNQIVLIKRKREPFKNKYAIPGGFVEWGENVEQSAIRETKEETNLKVRLMEILGVYSVPKRDPRGHTVSTVFVANRISGKLKGKNDAAEAKWFPIKRISFGKLSFDHAKILKDYLKWRKRKGTYWSSKW